MATYQVKRESDPENDGFVSCNDLLHLYIIHTYIYQYTCAYLCSLYIVNMFTTFYTISHKIFRIMHIMHIRYSFTFNLASFTSDLINSCNTSDRECIYTLVCSLLASTKHCPGHSKYNNVTTTYLNVAQF